MVKYLICSLLWVLHCAQLTMAEDLSGSRLAEQTELAPLPDMAAITSVTEKKSTFFNYLLPIVEGINLKIAAERAWLKLIQYKVTEGEALTVAQTALLESLRQYYKVKLEPSNSEFFSQMFQHVDTIPASMVLAQAANESAWGTSRFAVEGNNLFGQWCFSAGCGLVPEGRIDGASHEVKVFASVADSVAAYFRNLNTHYQYLPFRNLRSAARDEQQPLNSLDLLWGIEGYSSRGKEYIRELISMIEHNSLQNFDQTAFYAQNSVKIKRD